ncbi:von Willebrand factor A domain-containing protein 5A-like [Trichomycterus rosablanca]|uniref:von Willebrand factor A domain-containing protein 5A-like n=1 Tax=Trichomycterus rosablanca TaxID=2290929 RepID=UPI002F35E8E8
MENCGLLKNTNEPVPLKSIEVDLQVQGHVATVTSTLQYVNEEENPLEAIFVFPMPSDAALCHFSAKIADKEVVAEVQEKEKAREEYDDALSSGQQAFLLEESDESRDVFRLSVGSLPPGQSAAVTFIYAIELCVQADHSLRFCLPAVLNPRYTPAGTGGGIVSEITSTPSGGVPYSLSFTVHVNSPNPITKIESKCSLEPLEFLNTDHTKAKVTLRAGHKFDRDVELFLHYQNPHQLTAIVEAGTPTAQPGTLMGDPVVMLSFYPEFPHSVMSSVYSCGEFIFVMDRSGSMNRNMAYARDSLILLLKSLPMGCYFNIYSFGSKYEAFFFKSVKYSEKSVNKAVKKVKKMEADMGGTEILQPLKHIYKQRCIPEHPRQLFIFTDGEVGNTKEVLSCVRQNADFHRCFSFGIGEGASTALINGLAENASGYAQFITDTDRMQAKVMQSLRYALQPAVVDVREVWSGMCTTHLSPPTKTIFNGQRALIYAQLKGEDCQKLDTRREVLVKYHLGDQEVTNTLEFYLKPEENSGLTIHRLGARSLIRSLEREEQDEVADKDALKAQVVDLSIQSGVISSHTAFIAVHKGSGQAVKVPMLTRRVPTALRMCCLLDSPYDIEGTIPAEQAWEGSERGQKQRVMQTSVSKKSVRSRRSSKSAQGAFAWIGNLFSFKSCGQSVEEESSESVKDPLTQLVSLQKASGFWEMDSTLAQVFKKQKEELVKQMPAEVDPGVWATLLALIWLHGFQMDAQVEWQFVAMKAVAWIQTQKVVTLAECVQAGNSLLGCQVTEDALGI